MKIYVKVSFKDKSTQHFELSQWESILSDQNNLVAYMLETEPVWTGRTLNKVEVVSSEPDYEYSKKKSEPRYAYYKHKKTNEVVRMLVGELPDNLSGYELV